jgi:hypothetical protein
MGLKHGGETDRHPQIDILTGLDLPGSNPCNLHVAGVHQSYLVIIAIKVIALNRRLWKPVLSTASEIAVATSCDAKDENDSPHDDATQNVHPSWSSLQGEVAPQGQTPNHRYDDMASQIKFEEVASQNTKHRQ